MKTPSRTENINPYEAMAGEWTMTTASGKEWDVRVYAASEDDPDYNKILYVTGMMGYDWTMLTMHYSYNNEEGKPEVYIKAGELFAENVNFSGLGVCNIYLYNIEGNYLTLKDMVADVSADGRTLDFGENIFTAALFMDAQFTGLTWFIETGVKMTQKSGIKLNGIYYSLNAETMQATVIESYDGGYSGDIVIPESVNYNGTAYSVTSIGYAAFLDCSALISVSIPNSVTSIGGSAFAYCKGLISVTISNSLESIGERTFEGCSVLTSVTIPNSVTNIGDYAFNGCSGLTSVTIPNSVTSIGAWAFYKCYELLDVYCYAENVPSTDSNTFRYSPIADATLHVPATSVDSYKATAPWSGFGKIVALTPEETGIDELKGENGKVKTDVYDLSGCCVQKGQKGIFIQNGKVVVK